MDLASTLLVWQGCKYGTSEQSCDLTLGVLHKMAQSGVHEPRVLHRLVVVRGGKVIAQSIVTSRQYASAAVIQSLTSKLAWQGGLHCK